MNFHMIPIQNHPGSEREVEPINQERGRESLNEIIITKRQLQYILFL